jgi:hypothetical protein
MRIIPHHEIVDRGKKGVEDKVLGHAVIKWLNKKGD